MTRRSFVKPDASGRGPTREAAAPPQLAQWPPQNKRGAGTCGWRVGCDVLGARLWHLACLPGTLAARECFACPPVYASQSRCPFDCQLPCLKGVVFSKLLVSGCRTCETEDGLQDNIRTGG